ncbi:pyruvate dehydrogenase E1 component alpha subunit [Halogranum gelatinilyticum]|uniref:Pyruvate dehydrogenase E1 component alpha subunit n=1 Tax=Halogranum gelatinilyticum TaxID=660521 RepID=A0A1G9ZBI4_9EURY|nr:pyruvate dehydrogenase (acetyl-transferring) E1 component subunit alpha [Halogranum gelatinilyticum]SDN17853.1 pyruvate dehydrogenase E1 component alpha subunit [Halogranum gelatinilyticum]
MSVLDHSADDDSQYRLLNPDGSRTDEPLPDVDDETLLGIYEHMRLARRFDERAVSLQRQGRIATYAPLAGQEAAQVASAYALGTQDWLFPTYRDHAAKVVRGVPIESLLLTMMGHGDGYAIPEGVNVMPEYIPIATQLPQAAGAAMASRYLGEDSVYCCYFGDGATSEGDFHEGMNFAGVFDAPVVFFCNNNQWAISVPRERQTASETIAQKADAYGFDGVQVDGTDPLAVYVATREAVRKARDPGPGEARPTLIEAVQYRFGAHTTADDPDVYREGVPEEWRDRDPIPRYERFLRDRGLLDDATEEAITERIEEQLADAIAAAESTTAESPGAMFEHVYAEPTPELERQRAELEALVERYGEDAFRRDHS